MGYERGESPNPGPIKIEDLRPCASGFSRNCLLILGTKPTRLTPELAMNSQHCLDVGLPQKRATVARFISAEYINHGAIIQPGLEGKKINSPARISWCKNAPVAYDRNQKSSFHKSWIMQHAPECLKRMRRDTVSTHES